MGADVTVIIPIFGDLERWEQRAQRALDSVQNQILRPRMTILARGKTLAEARNEYVRFADTEWLIFLDADDELDPHYIDEMVMGEGDIRQPCTLGVVDGVEDDYPVLIPPNPGGFMVGNHLIIGCMVRREYFLKVGGFRDLPCLEDWDFWIRCRLEGASVGTVPDAIYRVHVSQQSRNNNTQMHAKMYADIQQRYQLDWNLKGFR